ncbi:hypothetical protein BC834DRAFT_853653 [Gloeopeniophorella convolvens]|nr:hypothetical protein BC834DRAFT_853653 [Gloeopeniophorella convolvens]
MALPPPRTAALFLAGSTALLVIGARTVLLAPAGAPAAHYACLALLGVPVGAYFVIANWVGWQYFRNS